MKRGLEMKHRVGIGALAWLVVVVVGCGGEEAAPPAELLEGFGVKLAERDISGTITGQLLAVDVVLQRTEPGGAALPGTLKVTLVRLGQQELPLSDGAARFVLDRAKKRVTVELDAPRTSRVGELGGYLLRYRVELPGGALYGRRSLYQAAGRAGLLVIGNNRFVVGKPGVLRIISLTPSGERLAGTAVTVSYRAHATGKTRTLASGKTSALGELEAGFTFTAAETGGGAITVEAGLHKTYHSVLVEQQRQILLTTDKPLYQPGQTVHIRALSMKQPQVVPVAGEKLLIEVEDPDGTKLFKQETKSDGYGIGSLRFTLARLVKLGTYKVRATMGTTTREKTFAVKRYTLPKFKVSVATGAKYAEPGATVSGWVQADYFFNKHVKQSAVRLQLSTSSAAKPYLELCGQTDDMGRYDFSFKAPHAARVLLAAEVTDAAGAVASGRASLPLSAAKAVLQLIPEREQFVVGAKQTYFVMLTDPVGQPRGGTVSVAWGGESSKLVVPSTGVAALTRTSASCPAQIGVSYGGLQVHHTPQCTAPGAAQLRLETDRAIYGAGDSAKVTLRGPAKATKAKLELIRNNITVKSVEVKLSQGAGSVSLPLTGEAKRTLTLRAHALVGTEVVADRKLVYVAGADQLTIKVTSDKQSYRPAEQARLTLQVTDAAGKAAPGAVGVQVVDEALYALTEVKPGLERSFFFLEQEVIDAGDQLEFVSPQVLLGPAPTPADQLKARMLFAAAGEAPTYPIDHRSLERDVPEAIFASRWGLFALASALGRDFKGWWSPDAPRSRAEVAAWVGAWLAGRADAFGQPPRFKVETGGSAYETWAVIRLESSGMDECWGTADDLSDAVRTGGYLKFDGGSWSGGGDMMLLNEGGVWRSDAGAAGPDAGAAASPGGTSPRQHFPETLYVDPALITDSSGKATIDLALADSITSWRMTSIASTTSGQLGSSLAAITVFQEFFVDTLLPTHLLQHDVVEVPVAIYNYLPTAQTVTVKLASAPWFTLLDADTKQVTVPAKSVGAARFKLRAEQVGTFHLTATGASATESDGIKRAVRVLPDGERREVVRSGMLEPGTVTESIPIPGEAIDGASELFVKVYPGVLSEVVEGLEAMLRLPHGCFEQTSAATYPNIMVLRYLQQAGQATPALDKQARGYIDTGYQRLVTFEVPGGGFSLYGNPPARLTLSAFGLMELADMAEVRFVDKALIQRTQAWLVSQQQTGGAFAPKAQSWYGTPADPAKRTLDATAYVAWALARSGYAGPALAAALKYVRQNAAKIDDAYSWALAASALLTASPADSVGKALLAKLKGKALKVGQTAHWTSKSSSPFYGYGASLTVETTALAVGALLLAKDAGELTTRGLRYLTGAKGGSGGYGTTQATVQALRALMLALSHSGSAASQGTLQVALGGAAQGSATVTPKTSDVTRLFDLKPALVEGTNKVDVTFKGQGALAYQVVGSYYLPHGSAAPAGPLSLSVGYDRTKVKLNGKIQVRAEVKNTGSGQVPVVMMRIGLPPGFSVDLAQLTGAKTGGLINHAELDGPYLVLYLGHVEAGKPLQVGFEMTASLVTEGKAPASSTYPYYTPEYLSTATTPSVVVTP